MKNMLRKLLCAALCIALLAGCLGTASAEGKKKARDSIDIFDTWYYVYDTIPEGMKYEYSYSIVSLSDQNYMNDEAIISLEVVFVSGDESLKDAITVTSEPLSDGTNFYTIRVDNEALTATGSAEFRIVAETENLILEKQGKLVVLDYNEYPLIEEKQSIPVFNAQIGETFVDHDLLAKTAVINAKKIAQKIGFKSGVVDILQHYLGVERSYEGYKNSANPYERSVESISIDLGSRIIGETEASATITVRKFGAHHLYLTYELGNLRYKAPFILKVDGFEVKTYDKAVPGAQVQCEIIGDTDGITYTWSVEGEGAVIDENGLLTIDENTPMGARFVVTAAKTDGEAASIEITLNAGVLGGLDFPTNRQSEGFLIPIPGNNWNNEDYDWRYGDGNPLKATYYSGGNILRMTGKVLRYGGDTYPDLLMEDPGFAIGVVQLFLEVSESESIRNLKSIWAEIDGHPARLQTFELYSEGSFSSHVGVIWYPRNTRFLMISVYSQSYGGDPESTSRVSIQDLERIASFIQYNPKEAPITAADAAITITVKDNPETVTAGKTIQFSAKFGNPAKVRKNKNDTINWTVKNAETGEEVSGVTISANGQLKVDKELSAPVDVQVTATAASFGNSASYNLKAIPAVTAIAVEPAELFFFTGKDDSQTAKVILTPETVPLAGITWTPARKDLIEIADNQDGTVSIKPLKAGKTIITVKEPSGKNTKLNVSVADPVETVTLALQGNVKAGNTVTINATLMPRAAGNKNVEWSLDVGDDIATIDTKGKLKIAKEAVSGTKITVTCRALGAPSPVTATLEVEIP